MADTLDHVSLEIRQLSPLCLEKARHMRRAKCDRIDASHGATMLARPGIHPAPAIAPPGHRAHALRPARRHRAGKRDRLERVTGATVVALGLDSDRDRVREEELHLRSAIQDALSHLDATAQAELVACGELTARDLVEAACERVARFDPELGAVPVFFAPQAREAAANLPGGSPFRGVPFLMKDVGARQKDQPYYAGNVALRDNDHRAEADTILGARFRALGLVTIGNSNSPEFGLQSNTWPAAHGPTHNPWSPSRSAGGSSGGACAAVAAGLVPVAHASDGAGSIRIPSAWCGLIGLKPSRDRIDWRHAGHHRSDVEFVVARSLRDTARFLDLLRPLAARKREPNLYLASLEARPKRLRVGLCTASPAGGIVHPACVRAVEAAGEALAAMGHHVSDSAPTTFSEYEERALHGAAFGFHEYLSCLEDLELRLGRDVGPEDVEPFLWELAHLGSEVLAPDEIERATAWISAWEQRTLSWFERFDLLVTPTVCEPAPPLATLDPSTHSPLELLEKMVPHMAFTEIWNATGQPAISLPLGWSEQDALPVGVQIVGAPNREDRLLSVAAALFPRLDGLLREAPLHA